MKIHYLFEGDIGVRLDRDRLPDLDMLMLDIWASGDRWLADEPTVIDDLHPEPEWEWVKISPCWCGEHGWHWDSRSVGDGQDLLADRPPRRFVAMRWRR